MLLSLSAVANAQIPPEMFQFVKRLVSTFGIGLEQSGSGSSGTGGGGGGGPMSHESLAKRAQAAAQDPAFQRLKAQFASDFDFRWTLNIIRLNPSCANSAVYKTSICSYIVILVFLMYIFLW